MKRILTSIVAIGILSAPAAYSEVGCSPKYSMTIGQKREALENLANEISKLNGKNFCELLSVKYSHPHGTGKDKEDGGIAINFKRKNESESLWIDIEADESNLQFLFSGEQFCGIHYSYVVFMQNGKITGNETTITRISDVNWEIEERNYDRSLNDHSSYESRIVCDL